MTSEMLVKLQKFIIDQKRKKLDRPNRVRNRCLSTPSEFTKMSFSSMFTEERFSKKSSTLRITFVLGNWQVDQDEQTLEFWPQ